MRVPWTTRGSNQSILKEINPEYSLAGLMLKLKLQYLKGHLMQRADSLEKTLMLEKIEGKRRRGQQRMRWLGGITGSMDMNVSKLWVMVKDRVTWHAAVRAVTKSRTQLSDGTTPTKSCGVQDCSNTLLLLLLSRFSRIRLCDMMDGSTPGLPVHHQLPEFTQTHVH